MEQETLVTEWKQFIEKHGEGNGYAHFDSRVNLKQQLVQSYILDPEKVAHHSFYPFIQYVKQQTKIKKVKGQKKEFKEKDRLISYSAHMDTCIYQRYAFLANQYYNEFSAEHGLDLVSVAYRDKLGLATYELAQRAFSFIQAQQRCLIMVGDFTNFFDKIDHKYLKQQLCKLLKVDILPEDWYAVFRHVTHYGKCDMLELLKLRGIKATQHKAIKKLNRASRVVNKEQFAQLKASFKKNKENFGIPQGSPISAVLANVYMMNYDLDFQHFAQTQSGMYMRYSDDTILVLPLAEGECAEGYLKAVEQLLKPYEGLVELQPSKTKQFIYQEGRLQPLSEDCPAFLDYLGLRLRSSGVAIKPKCFTKFYYCLRHKARLNRYQQKKKARKQQQITSNDKLYEQYSNKRGKRNLLAYLARVKRKVNLSGDCEAMALLKSDLKAKVKKALRQ